MSLDPKNIQEMRRVAQSAFDANVDKSTLINDLSEDGWGALYLDEAALYYDGLKKKVQKQPVAAGGSPSTSAKPVSLSELVPIKGDDTPPYLQQRALKQQEILQEVEKAPAVQQNIAKKNLFKTYESAISTVDSLDKSGETDEAKYRTALSGLSDAYDNYKQKNPDVDLPNFYDDRGGVNPDALSHIDKTRIATIADEESKRLKSEARRSNFLEAGVKQLAGGLMTAIGAYAPTGAPIAARAFSPLVVAGDEVAGQGQREMIGRRLEAGFTQEQIDSGFVGEAAKGNYMDALGLLGQGMLDQTVNLAAAMIPGVGLGVLGASAGGSAYLQVKDDDRYSDEEKLIYGVAVGAAEYIAERLFMTDINMLKSLGKSLTKAGVDKVSDIPKKEFADMLFGKLPKALRAPLEEGTEELFVGVVQQSLDKIMADEPFKPVELAEATILGASMGEGVFVLHKGPSAIGKIADLNQTISIRDRVDKINTLLQDPNITDEERNVLTNRLKVAKKEEERVMNNAGIFYANYSQEDAKATLEANQKLSSLLKSADKVKSEEGRAGIIDEIKTQIDTLKQIESKYDSKKGQQVPGAVQAGAQLGGIQQPGEGIEAAAPGGVLQTPEQEALASRVSAADSSAPKLGFKMKTPKRVPLNKDTAPEVYRSLLEAVDNYSDETLAQMQTTREEVREGVKSLFDVVSSLTKSGRDVSVDVYGSVADLNKGLGVSVKKQGRQYVISNEKGVEFYRTNKKKDADRWMGTFQTRGVYVGRDPQDGVTNVAILMPAMVANTGYHEGLHDVIPYVFGDVEISKIARAMAKATKSSARLNEKMLGFIGSYEGDGEAIQNEEFLTELASLISSGEIEVEVKDSIIDRFMKGLSDILGNPDFLKRKPSTEQFVRLLNEIAKRIGEGRELSVDISKGESRKQAMRQVIGENANLSQNVRDNLQVARDMEVDNQDAKTIRIATGWERGADGLWRYEIQPLLKLPALSASSPKSLLAKLMNLEAEKGSQLNLSDIVGDELNELYPQVLSDIKIELTGGIGGLNTVAYYADFGPNYGGKVLNFGGLEITKRTYGDSIDARLAQYATILHEIQHAIQDIEGFALGGSPSIINSLNKIIDKNLVKKIASKSKNDEEFYINSRNYRISAYDEEMVDLFRERIVSFDEFKKYLLALDNIDFTKTPIENYKLLAGEVESRNVEKRMLMSPEDRRRTLLSETEDVAREDQILAFDDKQAPKFQRVATFFSGAGTMEAALKKPESVIAVEYNPDYIKAYNEAFNMGYSARNVIDVSPEEVADVNPDIFHASPVCKNFSKAKSFATVEELDLNSAIKVADVITEARPPVVTIENVPDYKNTAPYQVIVKALDEAGYTYDANIYNAADYGGTQDRKRLIIRATREGVLPPLPAKKKFRDWFTAIEDMIDSAPDSKFTSRTREESDELSRISNMIKSGKIDPSKPIITMGSSAYKGVSLAVNSGNPSPTLLSSSKSVPRIIMPDGRVKRVTPEMMREIMDLPSSYVIPSDWKTAKEVLGNGIDGAITRAIIEPMAELGERINQSGVKFQKPTRGMAIDKELADIKARSQSDGTFMKAPNGKKTSLNEEQWLTVRTKSFKKWFGDWENNPEDASKIVDKNGEPLVVYHGTFTDKRDGEWYEFSLEGTRSFDVGFHFGTKTAAQDRINDITRNETDAAYSFMAKGRDVSKPRMIAAFLNIKNPIRLQEGERMPSWRGGEILSRIFDGIENESVDNNVTEAFEDDIEKYYEDELKVVYDEYGDGDLSEDAEGYPDYANVDRQNRWIEVYLKSKGFYGIVYENTIEDKGNDSYIVFNPNQIKSATENVGDFSAESPDIRFQKPTGKGAKNFDKWVGGNRLVTAQELQDVKSGEPIVVRAYHGTTNDFYEFDSSVKGNIEGHLGKLNYFTTDFQDASANYQSTGADLTNRIESRAEDIENFLEEEFDDFYKSKKELSKAYGYTANQLTALGSFSALAKDIAKKELQGGEERVLDVYIKLNNPVVLGNYYNKTWVDVINLSKSDLDEAAVEIADENDISVDEAKSDYESDIRQRAIENTGVESVHVKALERALKSNNYDIFYRGDLVSNIIGDDYFEESIELSAFENQMRKAGIDVNDEGEYAVGQVIADFFKNLGYDGIVLTDVSSRFRNMGLGGSTSHIHVFDDYSNQIKLADGSNVQFNEDTRDIRFQKPGEYKKAVEAAQAEVTNSVGAIFKLLGVDLGKPITRAKAIERRAKMQLPEIDPFKLFKKKYGEGAAKAIRTHVPSAMDYPQQFIDFIEKKVPLTQQIGRVVSEIPTLISADFQLLIGKNFKDRKSTNKTPEEILKETDFTFHRIKSNEDMRVFRADYDDNEVVCTLRDPNRINDFLIFWVRNKYADSILPANKLTIEYLQGDTEGAKMWRRYLKDVHNFEVPNEEELRKEIADLKAEMTLVKKNVDDAERFLKVGNHSDEEIASLVHKMGEVGTKYFDLKDSIDKKEDLLRKLNLPNALQDHLPSRLTEPSREDPYGRSSMSVQIGRGDDYIYKITNRYNHSASEPADSTLDKNLDNLVEGLQEAVLKLDEVTSIAIPGYKNTIPDGIITDSEGNYMAYDYSVDGGWYGTSYFSDYGFYVQDPSEPKTITKVDPNTQKIFLGVVFDTNKKTAMRWEGRNATELIQGADTIGLNIDKIQFSKNSVDIMTSKGGVRIEKDGDDFKLSGNITQIEDGFYFKVKGVKSIDFPNLVEIGDEFMTHSTGVTYLNVPRVKTVGIRFLAYNTGDYDSFNMQSLEHAEFEFGGIKYQDVSFPSLISVGNDFAKRSVFATFSAPKLEFVGDNFLRSSVGGRIYLPSLSEAGNYFLSGVEGRWGFNSLYSWLPNLKKYGDRFLNGALVGQVFMPRANKLLPVQGADLPDLLDKYSTAKIEAYGYVRDNYRDIANAVTALEILDPKNNFSYLRGIDSSDGALNAMADDLGSYNRKIEGVRDFFKIGRADYNDERIFDFMISRLTKHGMRILEAGDYRLNDVSDIPTPVSESKPKFQRPIDQTYEKSQERLKPSAGMGLSGAEKAFIDRQAPLKRALIKANLDYARNLLISQAGSGARAYDFITTSFKNIYRGLTNDQIKNVDKLIFLRRVIQIDEYKAANPQAEKIVHPDNWDGLINNDTVVVDSAGNRKTLLSAKKALADMKSDLGVTEYNLIYNATERYFDTYKKILTDMFEAGLVTQGLYDELKNLKYQPRVFINKILMRDENDPSEFRANLQDLSLKSGTIKKLTTGDVSEVIMDSRLLLAISANSAYSRIAKNKTKREVAKGLGRADTQDFMSNKQQTGFEEVIYYEDGIKKSFYLRGDLKSQLDDISSQIFQPEVAKWISTITGSRLIKLFATQANPLFVLKNIPRDYQHVLFFTNIYDNTNIYNAMYLLARDYIKGAKGKLSNSADFKEFLEYGGGMNFLSTEDRRLMLSQVDLKKMNFSSVSTFILNRIESGLKKTTEGLGKLGELSEVAVRLGVYTRVRDNAIADFVKKNGRKPNGEEMDVIKTEAVVSARQIIDFAQGGGLIKKLEMGMPYLNASFQGARVSTQYIFNNKIKFFTKILSLAPLVGAIALSNALIGDDDDMDEIPDTVKMMNFIILLPIKNEDGERHYLKIPKAQQLIPFLAAMELGATITTEALIESSDTPRKDRAFSMQSVSKDKIKYISDAIESYSPIDVGIKELFKSIQKDGQGDASKVFKEWFSKVPALSAYMAISSNYDAFYDQKVSYDFGEVAPEYEDVQNKKVQYFYKALAQGAADVHDVGAKRLQAGTEKFITGPNSSFVVSAAYAIANEVARASYDVKTDPLNLGRVVKEDEAKAIGARIASSFLNQAKMAVVRTTDKDIKRYIGREEVDEIRLKENSTSKALKDEANKLVKEARQEYFKTGRYTNVEAKLKEYLKVIEEKGATNQDARRFVNLVRSKMRQVDSGDWPLYYDSIYWASSNRAKLEVIKRAFGEKMTKEDFVEFAKNYSALTGEKIDKEVYNDYFKTR